MKKMIIIQMFSSYNVMDKALAKIGAEYTKRFIHNNFYGYEYQIKPFTGRGSTKLNDMLYSLKSNFNDTIRKINACESI